MHGPCSSPSENGRSKRERRLRGGGQGGGRGTPGRWPAGGGGASSDSIGAKSGGAIEGAIGGATHGSAGASASGAAPWQSSIVGPVGSAGPRRWWWPAGQLRQPQAWSRAWSPQQQRTRSREAASIARATPLACAPSSSTARTAITRTAAGRTVATIEPFPAVANGPLINALELELEGAEAEQVAVDEVALGDAAVVEDGAVGRAEVDDLVALAVVADLAVAARDLGVLDADVGVARGADHRALREQLERDVRVATAEADDPADRGPLAADGDVERDRPLRLHRRRRRRRRGQRLRLARSREVPDQQHQQQQRGRRDHERPEPPATEDRLARRWPVVLADLGDVVRVDGLPGRLVQHLDRVLARVARDQRAEEDHVLLLELVGDAGERGAHLLRALADAVGAVGLPRQLGEVAQLARLERRVPDRIDHDVRPQRAPPQLREPLALRASHVDPV